MQKKIKVLHISKYYYPSIGGVEDVCRNIVNSIKGRKFEQKIICFNDKEHSATLKESIDGISVVRSGVWKKFASQSISFSYYKELRKILKEFNPDFVHLHCPNPFVSTILLGALPKNTKLILHWHSDIIEQKFLYLFFRPFEELLLRRANTIIATSPNYIELSPIKKYKNKIVIIPNVVNTKKFQKKLDDKKKIVEIKNTFAGKKIVFTFARHVEYKGLKYLIDAMERLPNDVVCVIAGRGKLTRKLEKQSGKLLNKKIFFAGKLSDKDLRCFLYASDVFAFPSITKNEAFGVALAEAMYCGLPTVSFDIRGSGVNWVSLDKKTGIVVENRNSKKFADAISFLLTDKISYNLFSKNAKTRVENNFVMSKINKKILKLYDS